jgi:RimJ/RimL family protein N-acetyltransferase
MRTFSSSLALQKRVEASVRASRLRPERPWREHAQLYEDLFSHPAVAGALWPSEAASPARERRAGAVLLADIEHWQAREFGPWAFFERATGLFVGRGGLRSAAIGGAQCVEVLYAVRPDAWGRGYASEMVAIALTEARRLRLAEVVGVTLVSNGASRRVLEKAGLRAREPVEHAGFPHLLGRLRIVL